MEYIRVIAFIAVALISQAQAAETTETSSSSLRLASLTVNGIGAYQSSAEYSYSGAINWTPSYSLGEKFSARLNLGGSLLKGVSGDKFLMADYELLANYLIFDPLAIEAGGGAQSWFNNGGSHWVLTGNVLWNLHEKLFSVVDRFYIGYSRFLVPRAGTNEFMAGLGVTL